MKKSTWFPVLCFIFIALCSLACIACNTGGGGGGGDPEDPGTTTYTVTFVTNGGSDVANQTVNPGDMAVRPTDPTRSGYVFDDWYSGPDLIMVYDFSTPITMDITLYANWNNIQGSSIINVPFTGPTDTIISITRVVTNNLSKSGGGSVTLTINESFDQYEWFVGGVNVASGNNVTLQAANAVFITGHNYVTAVVYTGTGTNAILWSGEFVIQVNN